MRWATDLMIALVEAPVWRFWEDMLSDERRDDPVYKRRTFET